LSDEYQANGPFDDILQAKARLEPKLRQVVPDFDLEKTMKSLDHIAVRNTLKTIA
jgi:hypothetical protein